MKSQNSAAKSVKTKSKPAVKQNIAEAGLSLEPVFAALRKRYPAAAAQAQAVAFATAFYKRMEADEFTLHSADDWAVLAAGMLEFARTRKPGKANVRVFNPTLKADGWESAHTVLQIVNDDMPFLVDTVTLALAEQGIGVHVLGHPVISIARDKAGKLSGVGNGALESVMLLEIDRQPADALDAVAKRVSGALEDVRAIVNDWQPMTDKAMALADDLGKRPLPVSKASRAEAQEFLRWAADNHFTFFGYREYKVEKKGKEEVLVAQNGTGLGLMRGKDTMVARPVKGLAAEGLNATSSLHDALILTKTNARSHIHRGGYMDYIGVLEFDAKGKIIGEQRFLGLFTSSAYNRRPWEIPLVRQRYENVMARSGLSLSSHSGKALRHILESLPREELFQSSEDELFRTAMGVLGLQERVRSRLFLRRDKFSRFISALVFLPRERFNTDVRLRVESMLKDALHGEYVDSSVVLGDSPLAQVHLIVRPKAGQSLELDVEGMEKRLAHVLRNWQDDLREALVNSHGEGEGLRIASRIGKALPAGYIEDSSAEIAAADVAQLDALTGPDDLRLSLQAIRRDEVDGLRLKLYRQLEDIPLSDVLPMMENMGLRVIAERPYKLMVDEAPVYVQDFEVEST
ncbi:MAG: NAD-glutamate dehydrogenase, partial [Stenotrophomonas sp.]